MFSVPRNRTDEVVIIIPTVVPEQTRRNSVLDSFQHYPTNCERSGLQSVCDRTTNVSDILDEYRYKASQQILDGAYVDAANHIIFLDNLLAKLYAKLHFRDPRTPSSLETSVEVYKSLDHDVREMIRAITSLEVRDLLSHRWEMQTIVTQINKFMQKWRYCSFNWTQSHIGAFVSTIRQLFFQAGAKLSNYHTFSYEHRVAEGNPAEPYMFNTNEKTFPSFPPKYVWRNSTPSTLPQRTTQKATSATTSFDPFDIIRATGTNGGQIHQGTHTGTYANNCQASRYDGEKKFYHNGIPSSYVDTYDDGRDYEEDDYDECDEDDDYEADYSKEGGYSKYSSHPNVRNVVENHLTEQEKREINEIADKVINSLVQNSSSTNSSTNKNKSSFIPRQVDDPFSAASDDLYKTVYDPVSETLFGLEVHTFNQFVDAKAIVSYEGKLDDDGFSFQGIYKTNYHDGSKQVWNALASTYHVFGRDEFEDGVKNNIIVPEITVQKYKKNGIETAFAVCDGTLVIRAYDPNTNRTDNFTSSKHFEECVRLGEILPFDFYLASNPQWNYNGYFSSCKSFNNTINQIKRNIMCERVRKNIKIEDAKVVGTRFVEVNWTPTNPILPILSAEEFIKHLKQEQQQDQSKNANENQEDDITSVAAELLDLAKLITQRTNQQASTDQQKQYETNNEIFGRWIAAMTSLNESDHDSKLVFNGPGNNADPSKATSSETSSSSSSSSTTTNNTDQKNEDEEDESLPSLEAPDSSSSSSTKSDSQESWQKL